ncbi:hypothetical protein NQ317_010639 [Molorchus minor]|uniref:Uncharacterized protein n=1 Tax=Molorchus minor TaxID=1323400 RepID=A0ABQ9ITV3_9CUCU|nr:hypothetical protein NQ317_010639 [Molorchus minor]
MVSQLALDYMHLVCLGVVKRLLIFWTGLVPKVKLRLSKNQIGIIDAKVEVIKVCSEFARQPRKISKCKEFKATEFRLYLLYIGPIVLKDILPQPAYQHFLCLTVAIRILCDDNLLHLIDYAESLLLFFVEKFADIYGKRFISYNVHNLIHLCNEVRHFKGTLDSFSAFKYENALYKLCLLVKDSGKPLEQVVNRLAELNELVTPDFVQFPIVDFKKRK